jgi:hypothetical protein
MENGPVLCRVTRLSNLFCAPLCCGVGGEKSICGKETFLTQVTTLHVLYKISYFPFGCRWLVAGEAQTRQCGQIN